MLTHVTRLRYWKSDHNEALCEDACGEDSTHGLFVVADGVGTTLFSATWADFLVHYYLAVPLLSNDPFEVEWWIRQAQQQFKDAFPVQEHNMAWNAMQKIHDQGSYSTLAALRAITSEPTRVQAQCLAMGDSCIFVCGPAREQPVSFPLSNPADFNKAPICLPSKSGVFHRYFHRYHTMTFDLVPGDVVVLATDAVARWILSAGSDRYDDPKQALQAVAQQTVASWPTFIEECRQSHEMLDDDSTAIVIHLLPATSAEGTQLGTTTAHSPQVRAQRQSALALALADRHQERVAVYFGDGQDFKPEGGTGHQITDEQIAQARSVADALLAVLSTLRQALNRPDAAAIIAPIWQKYAQQLYTEACADNLRKTLVRLGVEIDPVAPPLPQARTVAVPTTHASEPAMLETKVFTITLQDIKPPVQDEQGEP